MWELSQNVAATYPDALDAAAADAAPCASNAAHPHRHHHRRNMHRMSHFKPSLPGAAQTAHLFIDASNVNVQAHEIPALDAIARNGFSRFATALVVGSTEGPSPKPAIWSSLGYQVRWLERLGRPESVFNVDTAIVAAMQQDILMHLDGASDRVMVLLSGDGNDNDGLPSFRSAVQMALSNGWSVKIICYKPNPVYRALECQFPLQMQIQLITHDDIAQGTLGCAAAPAIKQHHPAVIGGKSRSRTPSPPGLVQQHCTYFASGHCKRGSACKFIHVAPRHPPPPAQVSAPLDVLPLPVPRPYPRDCAHHCSHLQPQHQSPVHQQLSAFEDLVMQRVEQVISGQQRAFTISTSSMRI